MKNLLRWLSYALGLLLVSATLFLVYIFSDAFYHRYWVFPRQAEAWSTIREQYQKPVLAYKLQEYRGILHSHSYLSHDSEMSYEDILAAAKIADINFLFMSNHCHDGKTNYAAGWTGLHDGILFIRGHEGKYGFLSWGQPEDEVLDCGAPAAELAEQLVARGGMLFYAHSEEERLWDHPAYSGMEIYNIHTDLKDSERYQDLIPHALLSGNAYPDQMLRLIFDRQTAILEHWDQLNSTRQVVGFSANDAHQNNGIRGIYTQEDTLKLMLTSPDDVVGEWPLNGFTRGLLRLVFGTLVVGEEFFRLEMDPYERSLRYVNTHLFSESLAEDAVSAALKQGRAFIAFDAIADARGFVFMGQVADREILMGERHRFDQGIVLRAASPFPVRFSLFRDGALAVRSEGRELRAEVTQAGNYRLEAELNILEEWVPWIYTNPIYLDANP